MKTRSQFLRPAVFKISALLLAGTILFPAVALAVAEEASTWRPIYDDIMMCVNFGILAFIIVRFGKAPLNNFLKSRGDDVADEIDRLTRKKEESLLAFEDMQKRLAEGDKHIQSIKERVATEGERIKQKMIDEARQQSEFLLDGARKKVTSQYVEAKKSFRADLIDAAVSMAATRLPDEIRDQDQQELIDDFIYNLKAT
ncbi:MAG: ATP synthase F0 subunit B [Desulfosudaceae bacterium]